MRGTADPAQRDALEQEYRRDRERLTSDREAKIEKIRSS
jgi:LPS O-antigen subunit length determinant protein (WzzB/FepE family)